MGGGARSVAVVVVGFNSGPALLGALQAALAQGPAEVILVDNGSTDGSVAAVRRALPAVRILPLAVNTGFAAASNLGVACSRAPYVLFLNDDATLGPAYLDRLVAALEGRPDAASAQGKLLRHPGPSATIDSAGIVLGAYALRPLDRGHGEPDRGQYDRPEEIFGPTGAAALYRRQALAAVPDGPFDARLFAYYEDVDLAWHLGRLGWRHLYVPAAVAYHPRRGPRAKPLPIALRAYTNRYRIWRKNEVWWRLALYGPLAAAWESARLLRLGARAPRRAAQIIRLILVPPMSVPS